MLVEFFLCLRKHRVPCTLRELLDLINALKKQVIFADVDAFYTLSRLILVKDEVHYDKFDRAFAEYFDNVQSVDLFDESIPQDWLRKEFEKHLSAEEKAQLEAMGGLDKLLETLKERLKEQQKRHAGGNKWVGTGGTSPFGAYGYNPEGIRIGQDGNRSFRAVKVWDKREFRNFDADTEIGTRNMKLALRKLRKFARTGASDELDLDKTIQFTAQNAGMLDIHMRPERHNAVNVLVFFDVGGSMDEHIASVESLFSAMHSEFKHLEFFYFHNCIYEGVWKDNKRRYKESVDVMEVLNHYGRGYKVIFVGDATMGPYEITYPGGSVEHQNQESGQVWMNRVLNHFDKSIWLNPQPEQYWSYHHSIGIIKSLMGDNMFPLTLDGISQGIKQLT
ncbi:MAG: VWA domain-containing protein [Psychrosphaera sp.]|nr:VWA domain-containing protein [Psychrosphaera sp.]